MTRYTHSILMLIAAIFINAVTLTSVFAAEKPPLLDKNQFSIGGGVSHNSVGEPFGDKNGFQFFGAYNISAINLMEGVNTSVELGYMDYGFDGRDSGGVWTTMVVDGGIASGFGWLGRLGFDLGDDSGLMVGVGGSFDINRKIVLRAEYVVRDDIDSLQFNVLFRL
ncbi:hypothetical protein MNBD_GAMMA09-2986 [hydrothermal vent metagenome]|uniref:Outer membrane protein beta-barrel domain-containing protein n=1 Tax=hydrothermal vent metagenome TaxID=652676 RepID=A0A3B0YAT9_9ZZZZ